MREHLTTAAKAGSPSARERLASPPFPDDLSHLIGWLAQLPSPLTWAELESWSRQTRRAPARWEMDALMKLDRIRQ